MLRRNKFIILIFIAAAVLILVESVWLFLPKLVDIERKTQFFTQKLKEKGLNLELEKPEIKTFPDFTVRFCAKKILIENAKNEVILSGDDFKIDFFAPSLILKKINIKSAQAAYFEADSIITKDKRFVLKGFNENINGFKVTPVFKNGRLEIKNHVVRIFDETSGQKMLLSGDFFNLELFLGKKIDTNASGQVLAGKNRTIYKIDFKSPLPLKAGLNGEKVLLNGYIKNLDLSEFSSLAKLLPKENIPSLGGKIDMFFSTRMNDSYGKLINIDVNFDNSIKAKEKHVLNLGFNIRKNVFNIANASLKGQNLNINASGAIKNYSSKTPDLDINIDIEPSRSEKLVCLIPSTYLKGIEKTIVENSCKHGVYADLFGKLQLKGKLPKPQINGFIDLKNLYLVKELKNTPKGVVRIDFSDNKAKSVSKVYVSKSQFVEVTGFSNLTGKSYGEYNIKSTQNIDLAIVQSLLVPISEIFNFKIGPVPMMKITGTGNIVLDCKGSTKEIKLEGILNFKDASAQFKGLEGAVKKAKGSVAFKSTEIYLKTQSAKLYNADFSIDGKSSLDGKIDCDVAVKNIDVNDLVFMWEKSPLVKGQTKLLNAINSAKGNASLLFRLYGDADSSYDFEKISKHIKVSGELLLNKVKLKLTDFPATIDNITGKITFAPKNIDFALDAQVLNSAAALKGSINNDLINIYANLPKVSLDWVLELLLNHNSAKTQKSGTKKIPALNSFFKLDAQYSSKANTFNPANLSATAVFDNSTQENDSMLNMRAGTLKLSGGKLKINNIDARINDSTINARGEITNIFSKNPSANLYLKTQNLNLALLNNPEARVIFPENIKKILDSFEKYEGRINTIITIAQNKANGKIDLNGIKFVQKSHTVPISIQNGFVLINSNTVTLRAINAFVDSSPIFFDLSVSDFLKKPYFDGFITTKFNDAFVDGFINPYLKYPIKIKGDSSLSVDIKGTSQNLRIKPILKLHEGSDIFFMGANLAENDTTQEFSGDIFIEGNVIDIKNLSYFRYITSQNNQKYPMPFISAKGKIYKYGKNYFLRPFTIKTQSNTTAKFFNMLFKKSLVKQGIFTCDLTLQGNINMPHVEGFLNLDNLEIPAYRTNIKNISMNFARSKIDFEMTGQVFDSLLKINSDIENKSSLPIVFDDIVIKSSELNINKILNAFSQVNVLTSPKIVPGESSTKNNFDASVFVIKKGSIYADSITARNLTARDLTTTFSMEKDSILQFKDIDFKVAQGSVKANSSYNFKTGEIISDFDADEVDANSVAEALFGVKNQIFGKLNGNMQLQTKGTAEDERLKNSTGKLYFKINNGKLPKLGSLEYLLKANNLVKGGLTGLTVNGIVNLVTPMKTGYFREIKGAIQVNNGIADSIEIYSEGADLSIFVKGNLDLINTYADMQVWGKLSTSFNSGLGPLGNASLNKFFNLIPGLKQDELSSSKFIKDINKIPSIDLSNKDYRIFNAKIDGDINGDSYVSSFKWVER